MPTSFVQAFHDLTYYVSYCSQLLDMSSRIRRLLAIMNDHALMALYATMACGINGIYVQCACHHERDTVVVHSLQQEWYHSD